MNTLAALLEQRASAKEAYDWVAAVYREAAAAGNVPDDYEAAYVEHRAAVEALDERIIEVDKEERRQAAIDEARARINAASPAVVRSEPRTYGPESRENSFFADFVVSAWPGHPGFRDAIERLQRHHVEVTRDAVNDPKERERLIQLGREFYRKDATRVRNFVNDLRSRAMEVRAGMDTTSGSGGSFVTPQYLVDEWAAYRQYGREFANVCNKQELPDYGMTVYLPHVTAPAGVASQASQNSGITETDPTAGYLSAGLTTVAGQVTVSQQLLDRAGPGIQFDRIVFTQLQRAYNLKFDTIVLTQALANAGTVTNSNTGTTTADIMESLYADLGKAIKQMAVTAGTVMSPTHIFMTPTQWGFLQSCVDTNGRPVINPEYAGAFQAIAATLGQGENMVPEGDTGFRLLSLPVFKDANIPSSSSHTKIVVVHAPEVWVWEGPLVPRTIPQTYAQNLSVLLQVYSYNAVITRYQKAVQSITGARYAATPTWKQA